VFHFTELTLFTWQWRLIRRHRTLPADRFQTERRWGREESRWKRDWRSPSWTTFSDDGIQLQTVARAGFRTESTAAAPRGPEISIACRTPNTDWHRHSGDWRFGLWPAESRSAAETVQLRSSWTSTTNDRWNAQHRTTPTRAVYGHPPWPVSNTMYNDKQRINNRTKNAKQSRKWFKLFIRFVLKASIALSRQSLVYCVTRMYNADCRTAAAVLASAAEHH